MIAPLMLVILLLPLIIIYLLDYFNIKLNTKAVIALMIIIFLLALFLWAVFSMCFGNCPEPETSNLKSKIFLATFWLEFLLGGHLLLRGKLVKKAKVKLLKERREKIKNKLKGFLKSNWKKIAIIIVLIILIISIYIVFFNTSTRFFKVEMAGVPITEDSIIVFNEVLGIAMYEDKVVWAESIGERKASIYLYDFSNKEGPERIVSDVIDFASIGISENKVIWATASSNVNLRSYNLSTGEIFLIHRIPGWNSNSELATDIENNRIAELKGNVFTQNIYLYSLEHIEKTEEINPNIDPNRCFIIDDEHLACFAESQITKDDIPKYCLAMDDNYIVWRQNYDVYLYNIISNSGRAISTESGEREIVINANCPKIKNNKVAYPKQSSAIYLYDIEKQEETKLTDIEAEPIQGTEIGREVWEMQMSDEKVMYTKHFTYWWAPDWSAEINKCYVIDINSGEKTEIEDPIMIEGWPYCGKLSGNKVARFKKGLIGYKIYLVEV